MKPQRHDEHDERQSDNGIDELNGLTEEEIKIAEESTAADYRCTRCSAAAMENKLANYVSNLPADHANERGV